MPVYNGEKWLKEQLDSILAQLNADDELLIHDDGSSDNSLALLTAYAEKYPQIRLLPTKKIGHVVYNIAYLLENAQGNYILLSDQDDYWLPNKVKRMLEALQQHALVIHDCQVVDANKKLLHPSFFALHGSGPGRIKNLIRNSYLGCCMGFRREVLAVALPFPAHVAMHDIWLGQVAAWWFDVGFLPETLLLYRRHGQNASSTSGKSMHGPLKQVQLRLQLVKQLLNRRFRS
jgi:glycosyltransferase involved in cell wall biosynthesis